MNVLSPDLEVLPFVGRDGELAQLLSIVDDHSRSSAAIEVVGPAGIGKTRLVREFVATASPAGLYWESCRRSAQFGPWLRIARQLSGQPRGSLAQIVLGNDTFAAARSDLVEAALDYFSALSTEQPLTIVLDDLHEADADTLALTRRLASLIDPRRVTIVVTVRSELDDPQLISGSSIVRLTGLDLEAVRTLLGHADIAERYRSRTAGNPLHLERLLRRSTTPDSDVSLSDLLHHNIDDLADDARAVLLALTVLDRPSELAAVAAVSELSVEGTRGALATLRSAGLVDGDGTSRHPLSLHHALIGSVVLDRAEVAGVQRAHRRAADVLAGVPETNDLRSHHLLETLASDSDDSVRELLAAGVRAAEALANEEAARHLAAAATALSHQQSSSPALTVDVHLALSSARARLRDPQGADAALDRAWLAALETDDEQLIARSALGHELTFGFAGERGVERARRCEQALRHADALPVATLARLHAAAACHSLGHLAPSEARAHAIAALDLAEQSDDDYSIGCALVAWIVTDLDPDTLDDRLDAARRVSSIAEQCGAIDLARNAHFLLMASLLERGDVRAVDAELASRHRRSSTFAELENGRHAAWFRCMRALLDGRIDDAENLSLVALDAAQQEGDLDAVPVHVGQLGIIRWLQGRESEVEPFYSAARAEQPHDAVWSAVLARLWALSGRPEAARGALDALGDLTTVTRDRNWLITMATAAEAAAIIKHDASLPVLRELLLPYSVRLVPIGLGIACWGTVARPLALVCRAMGLLGEAEHLLRSAIASCSLAGAQPWIAQAQLDLAELLTSVDETSTEARELAASALTTARALSIVPVRALAESLLEVRTETDDAAARVTTPRADAPSVTVLGTFAVVGANGETASWTSRKARELLKLLVARLGAALPREEAIESLWPGSAPADAANRLSVALSTIRRALDPARERDTDAFLLADRESITLRLDAVDVDLIAFRERARTLVARWNRPNPDVVHDSELRDAMSLYAGEAFADEPFAGWAITVRDSTRSHFIDLAHRLVEACSALGNDLGVIEYCGRILEADHFDEPAHQAMIAALENLGAHGRAAHARTVYRERLAELGLDVSTPSTRRETLRRSAS